MKSFFIKLFIFFAIVFLSDFLYGSACCALMKQVSHGRTYQSIYTVDSVEADVLFMGTSRCRMTYDPEILSRILKKCCYNCGYDGMGIMYHYGITKLLMNRYHPKMIVYDVLPVVDYFERDPNERFLNNLKPFYSREGIDSIFRDVDIMDRWKMLSYTYRFHSRLSELLQDNLGKGEHYHLGYGPEDGVIHGGDTIFLQNYDYKVDTLKLRYVEKFIVENKNKTQIVFVASPRYKYDSDVTLEPIIMLCKKYHIPFLNHYTDSNYVWNKENFHSQTHLNRQGATKFSKQIGNELRNVLIK